MTARKQNDSEIYIHYKNGIEAGMKWTQDNLHPGGPWPPAKTVAKVLEGSEARTILFSILKSRHRAWLRGFRDGKQMKK